MGNLNDASSKKLSLFEQRLPGEDEIEERHSEDSGSYR